jgi:hypothetical protein
MRIEPQPTTGSPWRGKLDSSHVREKLAEAHLFLSKMIERERQLTGEPFNSYLNAFLMPAMGVRDAFHTKADKTVKGWRETWERSLTPDQARIYVAMREARNDEAHIARKSRPAKSHRSAKAGFKLCVEQEEIKVGIGSSYSDRSGGVEGYGSPAVLLGMGINTTVVCYKDTYSFIIDGQKHKVTEVCCEYLVLLERMVTQFEADHQ